MRSFYILISTLAIINMSGASPLSLKPGAENTRSGVVRRGTTIAEKRQVHSADYSSGSPPIDSAVIDPLRSSQDRKGKGDDEQGLAKRGLFSGLGQSVQNLIGSGSGPSTKGNNAKVTIPDAIGAPSNLPSVQADRFPSAKILGSANPISGAGSSLGLSKGNSPTAQPLDTTFGSVSDSVPTADDSSIGSFVDQPIASPGSSGLGSLVSGGAPNAGLGAIGNSLTGATSGASLDRIGLFPTGPSMVNVPGTGIGIPVNGVGAPSLGGISPVSAPPPGGIGDASETFDDPRPEVDEIGDSSTGDDISLGGSGPPQGVTPPSYLGSPSPLSALLGGSNPSSNSGSNLVQGLGGLTGSEGGLGGLGFASGGIGNIPSAGDVGNIDGVGMTQNLGQVLGGGELNVDGIPDVSGTIPDDGSALGGIGNGLGSGAVTLLSDPTSFGAIDDTFGGIVGDDEEPVVSDPTTTGDSPIGDEGSTFVSAPISIANSDLDGSGRLGGTSNGGQSISGAVPDEGVVDATSSKSQGLGSLLGGSDPLGVASAISGQISGTRNSDISSSAPLTGTLNNPPVPDGYSPFGFPSGNIPASGYPGMVSTFSPVDSPPVGYTPDGYAPVSYASSGAPYGYPPVAYAPAVASEDTYNPLQNAQASNANAAAFVQPAGATIPVERQAPVTGLPLGLSPFVGPFVGYQAAGPYAYPGYPAFGLPSYLPVSGMVPGYRSDTPRSGSAFQFSSRAFLPAFPGVSYSSTHVSQAPSNHPKAAQGPVRFDSSTHSPVQGIQGGWYVDSRGQMVYGSEQVRSAPASTSRSRDSSFSAVVEELQGQFHAVTDSRTPSGGVLPPKLFGADTVPASTKRYDTNGRTLLPLDQLD